MTYADHIATLNELSAAEGIFTTAQALRMGIGRNALSNGCSSGRIERIMQGAYRLAGSKETHYDELIAIWKLTSPAKMSHERIKPSAWDGIAVGGTTAAHILGIGDFYLSPYRLYGPQRFNSRNKSLRFSIREVARNEVSFIHGIPVTNAPRTILDLELDKEDPSLIEAARHDAQIRRLIHEI